LHKNKFDFVYFQETITQDFSEECFRKLDPNKNFLWDWILAKGRLGGVLSGFNIDRFDVGCRSQGDFILQHTIWDKQLEVKWCVVNVYEAAQEDHKEAFLSELVASFCSKIKEPYVIGGDFSIMRFSSNKNKKFLPNRFSDLFNDIINLSDLREIYVSGGKYTWSNNHVSPTLEKLDRILMSKEWENLFHAVLAYKKPRDLSYHNPLIIDTQFSPKKQRRIFKFELHWLDHSEFLPKIKDIWQGPTRDNSALSRVLLN
jgi:exonuclease III